jgi:hypothetical protein
LPVVSFGLNARPASFCLRAVAFNELKGAGERDILFCQNLVMIGDRGGSPGGPEPGMVGLEGLSRLMKGFRRVGFVKCFGVERLVLRRAKWHLAFPPVR